MLPHGYPADWPYKCRCEKFLMTVKHDPHMAGHYWLSDICQQRVDIVATKNGKTMFSQTSVVVAKDKFSDIGSCLCAPCLSPCFVEVCSLMCPLLGHVT